MNMAVNNFCKTIWFMGFVALYENVFYLRNTQYLPWWCFNLKDTVMVHKENSVKIQLGFPALQVFHLLIQI